MQPNAVPPQSRSSLLDPTPATAPGRHILRDPHDSIDGRAMPERPERAQFSFVHRIRVRWAEVDAQGIVFNPHYLMFADVGWTEYMRAAGYAYPQGLSEFGIDLFAAHAELDFFASAQYDEEIDLAVRAREIGRTSLRMQVAIFRGDTPLCNIGLVYVAATKAPPIPVPVPAAFADALEAFERIKPLRKHPT